ncbi:MAG: hypothetical protein ACE5I5_15345 [Candidatus Heimdallarchaeota archaeon]
MERSNERTDTELSEFAAEESEFIIPFFPNHLLKEVACIFLVIGALLSVSVLLPYELTPPSSPAIVAEEIGPAWYFNWMYITLRFLPRYLPADLVKVGVPILFVVLGVILLIVPFIDRKESLRVRDRKVIVAVAIFAIISWIVLTIIPFIP